AIVVTFTAFVAGLVSSFGWPPSESDLADAADMTSLWGLIPALLLGLVSCVVATKTWRGFALTLAMASGVWGVFAWFVFRLYVGISSYFWTGPLGAHDLKERTDA